MSEPELIEGNEPDDEFDFEYLTLYDCTESYRIALRIFKDLDSDVPSGQLGIPFEAALAAYEQSSFWKTKLTSESGSIYYLSEDGVILRASRTGIDRPSILVGYIPSDEAPFLSMVVQNDDLLVNSQYFHTQHWENVVKGVVRDTMKISVEPKVGDCVFDVRFSHNIELKKINRLVGLKPVEIEAVMDDNYDGVQFETHIGHSIVNIVAR